MKNVIAVSVMHLLHSSKNLHSPVLHFNTNSSVHYLCLRKLVTINTNNTTSRDSSHRFYNLLFIYGVLFGTASSSCLSWLSGCGLFISNACVFCNCWVNGSRFMLTDTAHTARTASYHGPDLDAMRTHSLPPQPAMSLPPAFSADFLRFLAFHQQ